MAGSTQFTTGFPEGNIEQWAGTLQNQVPRIATLLFKTIEPLIYGSLIELLGNSSRFQKKIGNISPVMSGTTVQEFQVRLVYRVPDFIGFAGADEPVIRDKLYILKRLQQVPGISWPDTAVQILPKSGTVTVCFNIPIGYTE